MRAHSAYLKQSCPFIKELLKDASIPNEEDLLIIVPDFKLEIVSLFLEFIYTGKTILGPRNFEKMKNFGFKQLGFFMMLNWNIRLEKVPGANPNITIHSEGNTTIDINTVDSGSDSSNEIASTVESHFVVPKPHQTSALKKSQTCAKPQLNATGDTTIDLDESHFIEDKTSSNKNDHRAKFVVTTGSQNTSGRSQFNATANTTMDLDESHFIEDKPSSNKNFNRAKIIAEIQQKEQEELNTTTASEVSHYIFQTTIQELKKSQENNGIGYPNEIVKENECNVSTFSDVSHFVFPKAPSRIVTNPKVLTHESNFQNKKQINAESENNVSSISDVSGFVVPQALIKAKHIRNLTGKTTHKRKMDPVIEEPLQTKSDIVEPQAEALRQESKAIPVNKRKQTPSASVSKKIKSKNKSNKKCSFNNLESQTLIENQILVEKPMASNNANKNPDEEKKKRNPSTKMKESIETKEQKSTKKEEKKLNTVTSFRKQCDLCKLHLGTFKLLKDHYIKVHHILKPFVCKVCGKNFFSKAHIDAHLKGVHLGDKPYECLQCDAKFFHGGHLKRHVKGVHLKMKPFTCDLCHGCFSEKSSLKTHLRVMH